MEEIFTKNVREVMSEQGIDNTELAKRCGVPIITIERVLNNKISIRLHTAVMISDALGMSLDKLCKV